MNATLALPDSVIEDIAVRAAQRAVEQQTSSLSPWLTAAEAADYLRCGIQRIRKLTMLGELHCHRDGRRVLYHREDLDKFVLAGGAYAS